MKNDYEIRGDVTAIIINSPKYGIIETLISTNKLDRVKEFRNTWVVNFDSKMNTFYVQGSLYADKERTLIILHRWITEAPKGMVVDHINHQTLDNRDDNLRIVAQSENCQNKNGAYRGSSSGIRGVSWNKNSGKWYTHVTVNQKTISVGYYSTIEEAERAVIEARTKYMPYSKETNTNQGGMKRDKRRNTGEACRVRSQ